MGKFEQVKENVSVVMEYRYVKGQRVANQYFACCDCGLVHDIAYVPLKTRLKAYYWRDNRRTANHRRGKKK